jgi:hypothetical protein
MDELYSLNAITKFESNNSSALVSTAFLHRVPRQTGSKVFGSAAKTKIVDRRVS